MAAIPFAWVDWAFMSVAVYGDKYKLVTPLGYIASYNCAICINFSNQFTMVTTIY